MGHVWQRNRACANEIAPTIGGLIHRAFNRAAITRQRLGRKPIKDRL